MKKLRVTIEGKSYDVLVEILDGDTPAAAATPQAPVSTPVTAATVSAPTSAAPAQPRSGGPGEVRSPLAGKIVSVDVKVGATVTEGQQLATIEAMKMNTYIYAPKAGTVAAILVNPGDGVEEGALLLQLT